MRSCVDVGLSDDQCVVIALAAACVDNEALIELCTERPVTAQVKRHSAVVQMTESEFCELFGSETHLRGNRATAALITTPELRGFHDELTSALVSTVQEPVLAARLRSSSLARVAGHVALHRLQEPTQALAAVLGGFVQSDTRRIEDLAANIEAYVDFVALHNSLIALASVASC